MASVGQVTLLAVPVSVSCPRQQNVLRKKGWFGDERESSAWGRRDLSLSKSYGGWKWKCISMEI